MSDAAAGAGFLIIFDCDGVLVDSEPISLGLLGDMLAEEGLVLDPEIVADRFLGRSLQATITLVAAEFGLSLPVDFPVRMRHRLFERLERDLKPITGVADAIDSLQRAGFAGCVASSSQPDRIDKSLKLTGLYSRFSGRIFSATMVTNGKPAPDLFRLAATTLNFPPSRCIVIEDSPAGIMAAKAANMQALAFFGGSHAGNAAHREKMNALNPDAQFDAMGDLLQLVTRLRRSEDGLHE